MISHLLKFLFFTKDEFVLYDYERIKYKNIFYNGVKSNNFLYDWLADYYVGASVPQFFPEEFVWGCMAYTICILALQKKDVEQILNEIPGYSDQEKERVRDILFDRCVSIKYLFENWFMVQIEYDTA